jgi:hypothetical protein
MTDIQFFAFVTLPIGVVVVAGVFTAVAMALIAWADRRHPRPGE